MGEVRPLKFARNAEWKSAARGKRLNEWVDSNMEMFQGGVKNPQNDKLEKILGKIDMIACAMTAELLI